VLAPAEADRTLTLLHAQRDRETGGSALEAAAKAVVLASAVCAVATALTLASGAIQSIQWYGAAAFAIAFVFAPLKRSLIIATLFATCYLVPAIIAETLDQYIAPFFCIWMAGLLGVIMATGDWRRWRVPSAFRLPVACWALTVAVSWPLVCLREFDFTTASIGWYPSNTSVGIAPYFAAMGVANAAATILSALLLIDWLAGEYHDLDHAAFARDVVRWLALSAAISAGVALYQATVNIEFLNGGVFPSVGRASGTMRDANPYGVLTALWGPAAVALIISLSGRCSSPLMTAVLLLSWCGAWVSGSRNSLIACGLGILFVVWQQTHDLSRRAQLALAGTVAALAVVAAAFALTVRHSVTSPIARFAEIARMVATNKDAGPLDLLERLWDPYGYGDVAWRMIREFPLFGVGIGTFNLIVIDYAKSSDFIRIAFDNAQNWFRHQFAELGLVGSLGWIFWTALFAYLILTGQPRAGANRRVMNIVAVLLVLIVTASIVGMPAMNGAASITFALFAGWYLLLVDTTTVDAVVSFARRSSAWAAVWAIVGVFAVGTVGSGRSGLRPPHRAERFGWDYSYGFYAPEADAAGAGFRRAAKNAVAVVDSPEPWMRVTVRGDRADVARYPVDVAIWCDGKSVLSTRLTTLEPVVRYVRVPSGHPRIMFESRADHGLLVSWNPVRALPVGAIVVD
jgi:hypothetical protein